MRPQVIISVLTGLVVATLAGGTAGFVVATDAYNAKLRHVNTLSGPPGVQGARGPTGAAGPRGAAGPSGAAGPAGLPGNAGANRADGAPGAPATSDPNTGLAALSGGLVVSTGRCPVGTYSWGGFTVPARDPLSAGGAALTGSQYYGLCRIP